MPIHPSILLVLGFVTSTALSMAITPVVLKFAGIFQLYDAPDLVQGAGRKVHTTPIPRLGGIAIVLSFFVTQIMWIRGTPLSGVFIGGFAVFLVGLADDILNIRPLYRVIFQFLIGAFTVWQHHLAPSYFDIGGGVVFSVPPAIGFLFAVFVIVGAINTLNMIDGLDGLAGGVALISVVLLSFLYFLRSDDLGLLLFIACPMIGAIIGFLRYNTHPAVIFMGDSGSNWLGFMVGTIMLILLSGQRFDISKMLLVPSTHVPLMSVILCAAIPVFDTLMVLSRRIKRGVNPMKADKTHLHHALLKLGLGHAQAVSAVYFLALLVGIIGVLPIAFPSYHLEYAPIVGMAIAFTFLLLASKIEAEAPISIFKQRAMIRTAPQYDFIAKSIRYWENFNRYLLYAILLAGPAFAGVVRPEVGIAAAAVILLILTSIVMNISGRRDDFLDSLCIALASTVLLVTNNANTMMVEWRGQRATIHPLYNGMFEALLLSTILLFMVTVKKRYFVFKPSDFLLAAIPLVLLLVPDPYRTDYRINIISLRSIVVFAAVRTLAKRKGYVMAHVKGVTLIALGFVYLAGVYGLRIVY